MTSTTERYRAAASQSASTVEKIADFWTQGSHRLNDYMLPGLPQVDLVPVVERYFEFVQRTVDISRDLTLKWAETAGDAVRCRPRAGRIVGGPRHPSCTSRPTRPSRPPTTQAEQAQKELARDARKAEREQARHVHDKARQRDQGLTKAELSDQLGPARPAQDRQRRRARGAPGRGRQQVNLAALPATPRRRYPAADAAGSPRHRAVTLITESRPRPAGSSCHGKS